MSKKIKITILDILVIITFMIMSKFIKIEAFSFCMGATYLLAFDLIKIIVGDSNG